MERREDSNWRQGSICEKSTFLDINDIQETFRETDYEIFIVVSHDCDIANDEMTEPFIEFYPARVVEKENGSYLNAKNPRKLHLRISKTNCTCFIELEAKNRFHIDKIHLLAIHPNESYVLAKDDKKILQSWLAARYRRHALPNKLHDILQTGKFLKKLEKGVSAETTTYVKNYWIYFEPEGEIDDENEEPYEVRLLIVHDGSNNAKYHADELASKLKESARRINGIDLSYCESRSSAEVTLEEIDQYDRLYFEYISHKFDCPDDIQEEY